MLERRSVETKLLALQDSAWAEPRKPAAVVVSVAAEDLAAVEVVAVAVVEAASVAVAEVNKDVAAKWREHSLGTAGGGNRPFMVSYLSLCRTRR